MLANITFIMIKIYYRNLRDKKIQQIDDFRVGAWVHVEDPTEEELQIVKEKFNLDEGLLRDATDQYEVPRMEVEDEVSYIFSRYPYSKNNRVSTSPILFILADKSLISISKDPFPLLLKSKLKGIIFTTFSVTFATYRLFPQQGFSIILSTFAESLNFPSHTGQCTLIFFIFQHLFITS